MSKKNNISLSEILKSIDEESATGTGASFSPGQGEQYATPKTFDRKKINRKKIKEDVSYTPDKAKSLLEQYDKDFSNYQSQAERLFNIVQGFSLGDLLEQGGEDKLDKISDTIEKLQNKVTDIYDNCENIAEDMYDNGENDLKNLGRTISSKYHKLDIHLHAMWMFTKNIYGASIDMKEDDLNNLIKYKK